MPSLIRTIFDAARQKKGQSPLIILTSTLSARMPDGYVVEIGFVAEAKSFRQPEAGAWNISVETARGARRTMERGLSYEAMLAFMKQRQIDCARAHGHDGTDDEIVARRQPFVPKNNIFKFVTPPAP
jgi:hypothetical protein